MPPSSFAWKCRHYTFPLLWCPWFTSCRTPCPFSGDIQLTATGSPYWLNLLVRRVAGPGDMGQVEVKEDGSGSWKKMVHSWGAVSGTLLCLQ